MPNRRLLPKPPLSRPDVALREAKLAAANPAGSEARDMKRQKNRAAVRGVINRAIPDSPVNRALRGAPPQKRRGKG